MLSSRKSVASMFSIKGFDKKTHSTTISHSCSWYCAFIKPLPAAVPESWRNLQQLPVQQGHHAGQHRQPGPAGWRRPHLPTAQHVQDAAATGTRNTAAAVTSSHPDTRDQDAFYYDRKDSVCRMGTGSHLAFSHFAQAYWVLLVAIWVCLQKGPEPLPET